jgi:hypothetical protein
MSPVPVPVESEKPSNKTKRPKELQQTKNQSSIQLSGPKPAKEISNQIVFVHTSKLLETTKKTRTQVVSAHTSITSKYRQSTRIRTQTRTLLETLSYS